MGYSWKYKIKEAFDMLWVIFGVLFLVAVGITAGTVILGYAIAVLFMILLFVAVIAVFAMVFNVSYSVTLNGTKYTFKNRKLHVEVKEKEKEDEQQTTSAN